MCNSHRSKQHQAFWGWGSASSSAPSNFDVQGWELVKRKDKVRGRFILQDRYRA